MNICIKQQWFYASRREKTMNIFVAVLLSALLSVAYAEVEGDAGDHADDFARLRSQQFKTVLEGYDAKLQGFKKSFFGRLEALTIYRELVAKSVVESNELWDPMLVLDDFTRTCIVTYIYNIPTVESVRTDITTCYEQYSKELTPLLEAAVRTRNVLSEYIETYNENVRKCGTDSAYCVTQLTEKTVNLVIRNKNSFQALLEGAECATKAHIKRALDCGYNVQVHALTVIAEVAVLVNNCLTGWNECPPCEDYSCSEVYDFKVNIGNKSIENPFYGRSDIPECIMLNAV